MFYFTCDRSFSSYTDRQQTQKNSRTDATMLTDMTARPTVRPTTNKIATSENYVKLLDRVG